MLTTIFAGSLTGDVTSEFSAFMKKSTPGFYILLVTGVLLMSIFGSEITKVIAPSKSWPWHLLLPGYSLGLMMVCASMFTRLSSHVRDLESKIDKLENEQR